MARGRGVLRWAAPATAAVVALSSVTLGAAPAAASTAVSSKTLLHSLTVVTEHHGGYSTSAFGRWLDADGDGCTTPAEVLIRDAADPPQVGSDCSLTGGRWYS